jgi:hypothetical protein
VQELQGPQRGETGLQIGFEYTCVSGHGGNRIGNR